VPHLVAAPDKFRGTATAPEAAAAICAAAERAGWTSDACPMSDGGEGFVDALGGTLRTTTVPGPLGEPTEARWSLREDGTAVIESASAIGRALLEHPSGEDPIIASSEGVGELVVAALGAGASSIVVGCGGTASTDGGRGCVDRLAALGVDLRVPLVVACDVEIGFVDAARRFGPQKGATPSQVEQLTARLAELAERYLERFGVDVTCVGGAGAGGGLAGGLIALGATAVSGARLVTEDLGLAARARSADAVVTGEGRLDEGTLEGKAVIAVLEATRGTPALVVVGRAEPRASAALRDRTTGRLDVVELDSERQARDGTHRAITDAVSAWLETWGATPQSAASHQAR
jgi:glycerate 2-kinase